MKIEDLNKTQIVLLTLLVSFVTSIATGVVTVSLMEQAPTSVTQTVNRIVERTIETVTPASVAGKPTTNTVTKETTVVVKEEDLITKSIDTISKSVVAVRNRYIDTSGLAQNIFIGWGIIMSSDGTIVSDSGFISDDGSYTILTSDGVTFSVKVVSQDESQGIAVLSVLRDKDDEKSQNYNFTPATLGDSNNLRLGQTAIALGGKNRLAVSMGIISDLTEIKADTSTTTPSVKTVGSIISSAAPSSSVTGGPLINSFGEVIGMSIQSGLGISNSNYTPVQLLKDAVAKAKAGQ